MFTLFSTRSRILLLSGGMSLLLAGTGCDDDHHNGSSPGNPTATRTATRTAAAATPTRPGTPPPTNAATPTRTATPGQNNNQGVAEVESVVASVLPSVLNITSFAGFAGGTPRDARAIGDVTVPCPAGGSLSFSCSSSGGGSRTEIDFNMCKVSASGAPQTSIDGTFAQTIPGPCFSVPAQGAEIGISFHGRIVANSMTFDFDTDLVTSVDTSGTTRLRISGSVEDRCLGHITFETLEPIVVPTSAACATGGRLRVGVSGDSHEVGFTSGGGVSIDVGADGSIDESLTSCRDADPASC